jgi:hypothetical protein
MIKTVTTTDRIRNPKNTRCSCGVASLAFVLLGRKIINVVVELLTRTSIPAFFAHVYVAVSAVVPATFHGAYTNQQFAPFNEQS